jgi:hypothetical protein
MWYAIDDEGRVVAHGETFGKCDASALIQSKWKMEPGTRAPYILTTILPRWDKDTDVFYETL